MFRPFKNLITYIQRNASGTSIFGSTAETELIQENLHSESKIKQDCEEDYKEAEEINTEKGDLNSGKQLIKIKKMEVRDIKRTVNIENETSTVIPSINFIDDDIEMQIKSNTVLRKPMKETAIEESNQTVSDADDENQPVEDSSFPLTVNKNAIKLQDQNQNHELVDLEGLRHDSSSVVLEDICSVDSESAAEDIDDITTGAENEEVPFLDLSNEIDERLASNELDVLNEPDLNSSINSDAVSQDPLAIDEFATEQHTLKHIADSNHLDSHQTDSSNDILWINIEDIKSCRAAQNDSCESTPTGTPEKNTQAVKAPSISTADEAASCSKDLTKPLPTADTSVNEEEHRAEELRGDGSDSGLGSETSALQTTLMSATDTSVCSSATPTPAKLLRSNLKRRLETTEDDSLDSAGAVESSSVTNAAVSGANTNQKKPKRSINFENVQVYYFPRQQGFGCVPSAGGCTLGMGAHHISFKTLTLTEHAAELRRAHRQQLQEVNPRGSSSEDSEESEEDYLSEGSGSDLDAESSGFLQPVSPKQRRALLKAAGVRKIDASEKAECRDIRNSREVCGCTCRDFCDPETCACSQAGIKCQVDRAMFPCGCSRDACGNTVGRVEFNPSRVRTHFIHTIMRLEMESRHQQKPLPTTNINFGQSSSANSMNQISNNYYGMQTQSNYSSGYASPAYPNEQTQNYYQQQNQLYSRNGAEALGQPIQQQYQGDSCLEPSLFCATAAGTPSYEELIPYSSASVGTTPTSYHAPLSYPTVQTGMSTMVSPYSTYNHSTSNYLTNRSNSTDNNATVLNINSYNSCAVPSEPPYGTATTTEPSAIYHSSVNAALETSTVTCNTLDFGNSTSGSTSDDSSFISLNSPISSSSRLSAINDLLQHNRNTTAALVAVTVTSTSSSNLQSTTTLSTLSESSCIDTPPIEYTPNKSCLIFEEMPTPLNPTPIVAVIEEEEQQQTKSNSFADDDKNTNLLPTKPLQTKPPPTPPLAVASDEVASAPIMQSIEEVSII